MNDLTIKEAAEAAGVSAKTIRRRLDADAFPNAYRADEGSGPWMIPVVDLTAEGFTTSEPEAVVVVVDPPPATEAIELRHQLDLAEVQHAAALDRLADENDRHKDELKQVRSDLEQERIARERAEREVVDLRARADEHAKVLAAKDDLVTELRADKTKQAVQIDELRAELATATTAAADKSQTLAAPDISEPTQTGDTSKATAWFRRAIKEFRK